MKMSKFIVFIALLLISPAAYAATITVGGSSGWDNSVNFANWVRSQTFAVGDSLVFNYDISHSVDEVREADYRSCNTGNAISSDSSSPTTIPLTAAGTRYFLCSRSNHCSQGMKVAITVTGATSPSPPSGGTTPSPPGATPSPPSETPETPTSGSDPPPPPAGGDASSLGGRNSYIVGVVVLGLVAMLMG